MRLRLSSFVERISNKAGANRISPHGSNARYNALLRSAMYKVPR